MLYLKRNRRLQILEDNLFYFSQAEVLLFRWLEDFLRKILNKKWIKVKTLSLIKRKSLRDLEVANFNQSKKSSRLEKLYKLLQ